MPKDITNNAKSDVYRPSSEESLEGAFNYGQGKTIGSQANSGYPGTGDRQQNGPISQPKPSEMYERKRP